MNATSLNALRQSVEQSGGQRDIADEKMEQVRELLVGDFLRANEGRIASLEARVRDLETDVGRRLDALHTRMEALAGELTGERRASFDELARNLSELGEKVRNISRS